MKRYLPLLLLLLGVLAVPAPAQAAACSGSSGVTVLVQYDDSPIQVGCAKGDPATGYDALSDAGFHVTLAQGSGTGAICRINNYPTDNNCGAMPPANAYWAYFHAKPGGSWSYSAEGGGTYDPEPGTVEGWRFKGSATRPPSARPPVGAVVAPTPTKKPTRKPERKPSATPSATPSAPTTVPTPDVEPVQTPATTLPAAPTPTAASSATAQALGEPGPVTPARSDSGGVSWIWGVAAIVVLAGVGGGVALRRRRG